MLKNIGGFATIARSAIVFLSKILFFLFYFAKDRSLSFICFYLIERLSNKINIKFNSNGRAFCYAKCSNLILDKMFMLKILLTKLKKKFF